MQENNKLALIKTKNFYASKDTIKRVKKKPIEKDKVVGNHIFDKRLIFRICILKPYNKNTNSKIGIRHD